MIEIGKTRKVDRDIAGAMRDGSERVVIRLSPDLLSSDEAAVQAIAHEMSEVETARYGMKAEISAQQFSHWTSPKVKANRHYQAIIERDHAVSRFRSSIGPQFAFKFRMQ